MIATSNLSDVIARWGTMYGGFFGLAVVLGVILLLADIAAPILVWIDSRRRAANPVGWIVALVALPMIGMLPAVFFLLYSPIIGTLALSLPLAVVAIYLFATAASAAAGGCPACGAPLRVGQTVCSTCGMVLAPAFAGAGAARPAVAGASQPAQLRAAGGAAAQMAEAAAVEAVPRPAAEPGTRFVGSGPAGLVGLLVATSGVDRGKEFRIEGDVELGRESSCQVALADPEASRRHAKIKIEDGAPHLYDLASTNGTFVNGERITDAVLKDNDVVRIGNTEMAVKLLASSQLSTPAAGGTMMKPAARSATMLKEPPSWSAAVEAGPDAGKTFSLARPVVVGREADFVLADQMVSRKHARIEVQDGAVFVEDLESSNGTEIVRPDGVAVKVRAGRPQPLAEGEKVRIGDTELSFKPPAVA